MSYFSEIRNDYICTDIDKEDGDVIAYISIDAWRPDEEQGQVIAQVFLSTHGDIVVSHTPMSRLEEVREYIDQAIEVLKRIPLAKPSVNK